jgi:transcriptional regulator of acetoin/glycerol metabolism
MKVYCEKYNKPALELKEEALQKLKRNPWPGNIREFQHAIEKAVILAESDKIRSSDFLFSDNDFIANQSETLEEMEKKMIINTLKKNNYSQTITADQLGITRQTLYNKIKKYGI